MRIAFSLAPLLSGLLLAACAPSPGPGAAVSATATPGTGTLVVANKSERSASLVDVASGRVYATLPTGEGPHEVAVSPDGRTAVVTDYGTQQTPGRTLTVLDLAARRVVRTIDLGEYRRPHGAAWLPDGRRVAVTAETNRALLVVDVAAGRVEAAIPTEQAGSHMVVVSRDGRRAYVSNLGSGSVTAVDLEGRRVLRTVSTGRGTEGIDVTPDGREVWVSNREADSLTVLDAATLQARASRPSARFPIRVRITPDGRLALVSNARSSELRIFDVAARREVAVVPLRAEAPPGAESMLGMRGEPVPVGVLISPDGRTAFVALTGADAVAVVDLAGRRVSGFLRAGREPDGMGWSPLRGE